MCKWVTKNVSWKEKKLSERHAVIDNQQEKISEGGEMEGKKNMSKKKV